MQYDRSERAYLELIIELVLKKNEGLNRSLWLVYLLPPCISIYTVAPSASQVGTSLDFLELLAIEDASSLSNSKQIATLQFKKIDLSLNSRDATRYLTY